MKKLAYIGTALALPLLAAAQINDLGDVAEFVLDFINNIAVPLLFTLAFLFFLWGVFLYIVQGKDSDEKRKEGGKFILWGIIGIFVMASVWGLVNILVNTFDLDNDAIELPEPPSTDINL